MHINPNKLTKQEIVDRLKFRCKHGHNGFSHPSCYAKEKELVEHIGCLDIEASNLSADFGIILCWAIYDLRTDEIIYDHLIPEDLKKGRLDKRIVETLCEVLPHFDRVVTHYGCVTAGHKILTADLRWVPVETLKAGDKLLGFDAERNDGQLRQFRESIVLHNYPFEAECYMIELDDGTDLISTGNHPWLIRAGTDAGHSHYRWRTTRQLMDTLSSKKHNGGIHFCRILPVWEDATSFEEGWLSGFFDGEGNCNQGFVANAAQPHFQFAIKASQKPNTAVKEAKRYLKKLGFRYSITNYDPQNKNIVAINILGGKDEKIRFLGQIRPSHLLEQFDINQLGALRTHCSDSAEIVNIVPVGKMMVYGLGTSTETYFVEGFGSHNSRFDIPYIRTRALKWGLDDRFPAYGQLYHTDVWRIARTKLKLHSNRQGSVASGIGEIDIKTKIHPHTWLTMQFGTPQERSDAIAEITEHCCLDVEQLATNYRRLAPFVREGRRSI